MPWTAGTGEEFWTLCAKLTVMKKRREKNKYVHFHAGIQVFLEPRDGGKLRRILLNQWGRNQETSVAYQAALDMLARSALLVIWCHGQIPYTKNFKKWAK